MKSLGDGLTIGLIAVLLIICIANGAWVGFLVGAARGEENIYLDIKYARDIAFRGVDYVCEVK